MSPSDATKLLELPADASPEQVEARFHELRTKLEEKIGKAPTPGLKAKYRESLEEITTAFETLTLAADGSSLPVLRKESGAKGPASAERASPGAESPVGASLVGAHALPRQPGTARPKKSSSKEFLLVAVIAIALLAAGGWFIMNTRAESAEKTRIAAEAKAEADRRTEESRLAAQQEKDRLAAVAKAEQEKAAADAAAKKEQRDKLSAQVRIALAESKLQWDAIEKIERDAERALSELKSEERSLRDAPEGRRRELSARIAANSKYVQWLGDFLSTHPVKTAQVRAAEFLNSGLIDEAVAASTDCQQAMAGLGRQIDSHKPTESALYGTVTIVTEPAGIPWKLADAFGNIMSGKTPGTADRVAAGPATVFLQRQDWEESQLTVSVTAGKEARTEFVYRPASLQFTSTPTGAEVLLNGKPAGRTPLTVTDLPNRSYSVELQIADHKPWTETLKLNPGEQRKVEATLRTLTDQEFIAQCSTRWSGTWSATVRGTPTSCKFVADSTRYEERYGGEYANLPPMPVHLVVVSRSPLILDRILKYTDGRIGLDGSTQRVIGRFKEQDGRLIYVWLDPKGRNSTEYVLQRTGR